ncbi:MAG: DNA repair protein RadA [Lachnospiraceae bacterium]|nr:DNA repair protein RadA [Lachnospiraceae bacterium]
MAKIKKSTAFFCQECGYESAKWTGQCPVCKAWNTMVEEPVRASSSVSGGDVLAGLDAPKPLSLSEIPADNNTRTPTGFDELDRVMGGGIVDGSLVLIGGDPGIGKSTLLLQVAAHAGKAGRKVLYVSGEESIAQIGLRAKRLFENDACEGVKFLCETDLAAISALILDTRPHLVIIDSIQTMMNDSVQSAPGSVAQVRETTGVLLKLAKQTGITFFIIGHVTKEGAVAGPRVLEHMVDTVLYFEGDRYNSYRIVRGVKNRFGATNELGIFEMRKEGLVEVKNASEFLLSGRPAGASGCVVTCSMEGTRPLLIEVQSLVSKSAFGFARRQATGTDINRINLLMAVLEKHMRLPLSEYDAYFNLAGGMTQKEPALDLGIVMAVISGFRSVPIPDDTVVFGEVGLSGEIRSVTMASSRVTEAARMGFKTCILPKSCEAGVKNIKGIRIIGVSDINEAAAAVFGRKNQGGLSDGRAEE